LRAPWTPTPCWCHTTDTCDCRCHLCSMTLTLEPVNYAASASPCRCPLYCVNFLAHTTWPCHLCCRSSMNLTLTLACCRCHGNSGPPALGPTDLLSVSVHGQYKYYFMLCCITICCIMWYCIRTFLLLWLLYMWQQDTAPMCNCQTVTDRPSGQMAYRIWCINTELDTEACTYPNGLDIGSWTKFIDGLFWNRITVQYLLQELTGESSDSSNS